RLPSLPPPTSAISPRISSASTTFAPTAPDPRQASRPAATSPSSPARALRRRSASAAAWSSLSPAVRGPFQARTRRRTSLARSPAAAIRTPTPRTLQAPSSRSLKPSPWRSSGKTVQKHSVIRGSRQNIGGGFVLPVARVPLELGLSLHLLDEGA